MDQNCKFYCYRNTRKQNQQEVIKPEKIKLVVFDMDGVLADIISSWKYIHDYFGSSNDRSVSDYLQGKIDDMEFIRRDVELWQIDGKPVTRKKLIKILSNVPLMNGAEKCITYLNKNDIKTAIVSAGLNLLAERIAKQLGIDYICANGLKTDKQGYITGVGVLGVKLMYKDEAIRSLAKQNKISLGKIAAVGNSCFDIPMFETTGHRIAFNPDDNCVRKAADIIIENKDLTKIIPYIDNHIN